MRTETPLVWKRQVRSKNQSTVAIRRAMGMLVDQEVRRRVRLVVEVTTGVLTERLLGVKRKLTSAKLAPAPFPANRCKIPVRRRVDPHKEIFKA